MSTLQFDNLDLSIYLHRDIKNSFNFNPSTNPVFFVAGKRKNGNFYPVFARKGCRTYMPEPIFDRKSGINMVKSHWQYTKEFSHTSGKFHVGVQFAGNGQEETFLSRFSELNKIEKEFKITESTYTKIDNYHNMYIVSGSKYWKDSCWKMTLYTHTIKSLIYKTDSFNGSYMSTVKKYYKELFGNVKMPANKEVFDPKLFGTDTFNRHQLTGFYSICTGLNNPMAKVLGIKVEKPVVVEEEDEDNE